MSLDFRKQQQKVIRLTIADWDPEWADFVPSDTEREMPENNRVEIPTPSWRVNCMQDSEVEASTSRQGYEMTEDEVYHRRHKKLEKIEHHFVRLELKRRKQEKIRELNLQKQLERKNGKTAQGGRPKYFKNKT